MNRESCFQIIRSCEHMCCAGQVATCYYLDVCKKDPTIAEKQSFRIRDIRDCNEDLESTYIVRILAEFETILRDYWKSYRPRNTKPMMKVLVDRIALHCYIQHDVLRKVHAVREYRNSLVHSGVATSVTLRETRSYLCRFIGNLPRTW